MFRNVSVDVNISLLRRETFAIGFWNESSWCNSNINWDSHLSRPMFVTTSVVYSALIISIFYYKAPGASPISVPFADPVLHLQIYAWRFYWIPTTIRHYRRWFRARSLEFGDWLNLLRDMLPQDLSGATNFLGLTSFVIPTRSCLSVVPQAVLVWLFPVREKWHFHFAAQMAVSLFVFPVYEQDFFVWSQLRYTR